MKRYPDPVRYIPKNPDKYLGDGNNIWLRSSWERKFAVWADRNPAVLNWGSEEIIIPYLSPVDGKMHRYFPDFAMTVKTRSGGVRKFIVEIKPYSQSVMPVKGNKKNKTFLNEAATYTVNQAKWQAAEMFCKKSGIEFVVLTERDLF